MHAMEPCPIAVERALRTLRLPTSRGELRAILFRLQRDPQRRVDTGALVALWREARDETLAAVEG